MEVFSQEYASIGFVFKPLVEHQRLQTWSTYAQARPTTEKNIIRQEIRETLLNL
jgi:hypothetical protein